MALARQSDAKSTHHLLCRLSVRALTADALHLLHLKTEKQIGHWLALMLLLSYNINAWTWSALFMPELRFSCTLVGFLGHGASRNPWVLLENRLGETQEPRDPNNKENDAQDGTDLREAAHVRQVALIICVHGERLLLEEDATMVQKDVPNRVDDHEYRAERDEDGRHPAGRPGLSGSAVAVARYVADNAHEQHDVCAKRKVVHSLAVVESRHLARHTEYSHQQQRPTSDTQNTGYCHQHRRSHGRRARLRGRLARRCLRR